MQSMGRSMDWTLEDNMVNGLFFYATLTGRRGGHTPFVQAGNETSDAGAEAVKPDPRCSWQGHSGGWVLVSGWKYGVSCRCCPTTPPSIGDPPSAPHFCCCCQVNWSCCAAGTNGCLDLNALKETSWHESKNFFVVSKLEVWKKSARAVKTSFSRVFLWDSAY